LAEAITHAREHFLAGQSAVTVGVKIFQYRNGVFDLGLRQAAVVILVQREHQRAGAKAASTGTARSTRSARTARSTLALTGLTTRATLALTLPLALALLTSLTLTTLPLGAGASLAASLTLSPPLCHQIRRSKTQHQARNRRGEYCFHRRSSIEKRWMKTSCGTSR
jgi:hypothetical protein